LFFFLCVLGDVSKDLLIGREGGGGGRGGVGGGKRNLTERAGTELRK